MYINFTSPPMPHLIVGGISIFRKGDRHERRAIHNTFDLIYVRSGTMYMEEEGKQFDVGKGQFLILAPDKTHAGYRHCDEDTVFSWIHFYTAGDFSFSEKPVQYMPSKMNKNKYYQKDKFYISIPQYGTLNSKYHRDMEGYLDQISQVRIDKYNQQKLFYNSAASQIDYQILFMKIISHICESSEKPQEKDLAEEICQYLKHSYAEPFNLTELAHRFSFHPAYIIRCTKSKYGYTPLQLLISIRMEEAKKLLTTTNLHVNIIAQNVGCHDTAYFSKLFKSNTGMTALEYRRREKGAVTVVFRIHRYNRCTVNHKNLCFVFCGKEAFQTFGICYVTDADLHIFGHPCGSWVALEHKTSYFLSFLQKFCGNTAARFPATPVTR